MKIGLDLGHGVNYDGGAVGIRKEEECIDPVGRLVTSKLIQLGHEVIELRPSNASSLNDSLKKRCYAANMAHVDIVVSIHFNIGGGHGTEVYAVSDKGREYATKVLNEIVKLGYTNRGVKSANFYILKNTIAPAILIEGGFLDSQEDMNRYNAEAYANAIVKGITGQTVTINKEVERIDNMSILEFQKFFNTFNIPGVAKLVEDGIDGPKTQGARAKLKAIFQYILA